ncbi:hypothetical protein [uncultured Paenibacillus sp.]|uniref:hypothetical protein n=1 Tax=uncultured Paenibacillus sp. TaxID=227322 RepID=UPI0028D864FD|nr:hypothetical protein [uncultured Paenibacillus sp.]
MKKALFLLLVVVLLLPSTALANSESPDTLNGEPTDGVLEGCTDAFQSELLAEASPSGGVVMPNATCTGSGGVSRIDWLADARNFAWSVDPRWSTIYNFSGQITITSGGKIVDTIPVSCWDVFGGSCGGTESFIGAKYTSYQATLTGTAQDASGLEYVAYCSINIYYV